MRGRKSKQESRADELRQRLITWKEIPESLRPSLRALAAEIGVSHQLLTFYLEDLEEWYRSAKKRTLEKADRIRARVAAENREMTMRECIDVIIAPGMLDRIESLRQEAKRGPLHRAQFEMLKRFAKQGLPGAQDALQECSRRGVKKRKRFAEIVKETARIEGETSVAWVRRIWDECEKYETKCPDVITAELLVRLSQSG